MSDYRTTCKHGTLVGSNLPRCAKCDAVVPFLSEATNVTTTLTGDLCPKHSAPKYDCYGCASEQLALGASLFGRMASLLRRLEWAAWSPEKPSCPSCHSFTNEGHTPTCPLHALLRDLP